MAKPSEADVVAVGHLIDEKLLREKYKEALASGCTPEFAKKYIAEVAGAAVTGEARTIHLRPGVIEAVLSRAKVV